MEVFNKKGNVMDKEQKQLKVKSIQERIDDITLAIEVLIIEHGLFVDDVDSLLNVCNLLSTKREVLRDELKELENEVMKWDKQNT